MIRIALTNLGRYNEGFLVFKWLELPATDVEIQSTLKEIGVDGEEYEEYFISDYETDIPGLTIGEYENIDKLNELAKWYDYLSEYDQDLLRAMIDAHDFDLDEAKEYIENGDYRFYPGVTSYEELAEIMVDEGLFGDVLANILPYLDYKKIGYELEIEGWQITDVGAIYV